MDIFQIIVPYIQKYNYPNRLTSMKIYTYNREHVHSFIQQHRITIYDINVIPDDEDFWYDDNIKPHPVMCNDKYTRPEHTLRPYSFYSSTDRKFYTIITTPFLVKHAKYYVGGNLGDHLSFGDLILRDDIPIVEIIFKLIESLPYTAIAEYADIDKYNCTDSQLEYKLFKYNSLTSGDHSFDTTEELFYEYIYNSLGCYEDIEENNMKPQTITLEGYVEYISRLSIK